VKPALFDRFKPASTKLEKTRQNLTEKDLEALIAISEGYDAHGEQDRFILVENPKFRDDTTEDPYLVISMWRLQGFDDDGELETA